MITAFVILYLLQIIAMFNKTMRKWLLDILPSDETLYTSFYRAIDEFHETKGQTMKEDDIMPCLIGITLMVFIIIPLMTSLLSVIFPILIVYTIGYIIIKRKINKNKN